VEREKVLLTGQKSLWSPEGEVALTYLREKRHLSDEVIRRFQLGYCPREENHFLAGRVLMPVFDAHGQIIAISTRDYEAPKQYQHWHESFDKLNHLYGLDVAKRFAQWNRTVIVVEGQFDVMCLHSYGLPMTVGVFGTSFSIMHVARLARYCSDFYLVFDDDTSGDAGKDRAAKLYNDYSLANYGINFFPVTLPERLDPDDYVFKYGKEAFSDILLQRKLEVLNG
jgi:DNA primase